MEIYSDLSPVAKSMLAVIAACEGNEKPLRELERNLNSISWESLIHVYEAKVALGEDIEPILREMRERISRKERGSLRLLAFLAAKEPLGSDMDAFLKALKRLRIKKPVLRKALAILFRYAILHRSNIASRLDEIFEASVHNLHPDDFAEALRNYFALAPFFGPQKEVVEWASELAGEVNILELRGLRFLASYILALRVLKDEGWKELYEKAEREWTVQPSRTEIFRSAMSLMGRSVLLYSLIDNASELKDKARSLAGEAYLVSSFIRDALKEVKKGEMYFGDATIYLAEVPEEEVRYLFDAKQYLQDSGIAVKEAITGISSAAVSCRRLTSSIVNGEIVEKFTAAVENLRTIPPADRYEAKASAMALIGDADEFKRLLKELSEKGSGPRAHYLVGYWAGVVLPELNVLEDLASIAGDKINFAEGFIYSAYGAKVIEIFSKLSKLF